MERNKEEDARKAMDIAEKKLSENDFIGAKEFVNKAQNLYPTLDGLEQVSMMIDVFISASNKSNGREGEADWYGILGVDPSADDETVKKQYKKLALFIHPDKNKFNGAEEAFKLVLNAFSLLTDKDKRSAYDRKRKWKDVKPKNTQNQQKPPNSTSDKPKPGYDYEHQSESDSESDCYYDYDYQPKPKRKTDCSWNRRKEDTFWTACDKCKTYCEYPRSNYLNKTMPCPNCNQDFVATEIIPEMINGRPVIRFSFPQQHQQHEQEQEQPSANDSQPTNKSTTSGDNNHSSSKMRALFSKLREFSRSR